MLEYLAQYWWILLGLLYTILLVFLMRRGLWESVGRKILLAAICVFILLIPSTRWAGGYPFAALVVLNLLTFVATENRHTKHTKTVSKRSDD
ncbi:hypothetical protein H7J88_24595 [Mycolicibacterium flavescens]|uniref:Uncharacterized protein n=1 Tax=Mycolicibacterium flavescens TaxID=1776 RepID=A0A1E3RFS9_MYCFV|nr:hypothetical protein [Mycolicibacterium flavescens]MCV7282819.1 hypothetical protein [Mycolicibacterium flavescens]ODQ88728.1 hypothetical protein BHQ18_17870 [Mycolicibacterium flavescens]